VTHHLARGHAASLVTKSAQQWVALVAGTAAQVQYILLGSACGGTGRLSAVHRTGYCMWRARQPMCSTPIWGLHAYGVANVAVPAAYVQESLLGTARAGPTGTPHNM
jgi:hypothetical protein